jgi:WD40-like Beta Propeller Repeat
MPPHLRRTLAHQATRLAALGLAMLGCGREPTDPDPEPSGGTLRVLMRTAGATLDGDGYTYRVGSTTLTLAVQDSQDIGLPAGRIAVGLNGVADNCRPFSPGPDSVTIAEAEISSVRLVVSCDSTLRNVILFEHWPVSTRPDLWLMRPDGTGKALLLAGAWTPAATPGGTEIVYSDWATQQLFRIRADRTGVQLVAPGLGGGQSHPDVSPDGRSVVFARAGQGFVREIYRAGLDGGEVRQLTSGSNDIDPRWSPDGRFITFDRLGSDNVIRVYRVPAEGGDALPLTADVSCCGRWKSDGTLVVTSDGRLTTMRPDGGDATPIKGFFVDGPAEWSPDGAEVLIEAFLTDHTEIWRVQHDGVFITSIADAPVSNHLGRWLP